MAGDRLSDPFLEHVAIVASAPEECNACSLARRPVGCGVRWIVVALVCVMPVVGASAHPHLGCADPPGPATLGDPGRASLEVGLGREGETAWLTVGLAARVDLVIGLADRGPKRASLRCLCVDGLGPLQAALLLSTDGPGFAAGLLLGPVRLDWGRWVGGSGRRWAVTTLSLSDDAALVLDLDEVEGRWSFSLRLRWLESGSWWASIGLCGGSIEVRVGAMT